VPIDQPAAARPVPVRSESARPELPGATLPQTEPQRQSATQPQQLTVEPAAPRLALTGIAWNKDSADRLAIINGQAIGTGATVGGATVEEILPDRVRLSSRGKSFELLLGK
jgi:general secretion pathway protein B